MNRTIGQSVPPIDFSAPVPDGPAVFLTAVRYQADEGLEVVFRQMPGPIWRVTVNYTKDRQYRYWLRLRPGQTVTPDIARRYISKAAEESEAGIMGHGPVDLDV